MKCDEVQTILEESRNGIAPQEARVHLDSCADCTQWWSDWQTLEQGFRLLSRDEGPEPSWGFSERLVRRLGESVQGQRSGELIERAGKRVVWATLALTLTAILALVIPSSGPVRAASEPEYLLLQPQLASSQNYGLVDVENSDDSAPQAALPAASRETK
jgi:hypothetical protein